jgi:hypothetical protein
VLSRVNREPSLRGDYLRIKPTARRRGRRYRAMQIVKSGLPTMVNDGLRRSLYGTDFAGVTGFFDAVAGSA